MNKRSKKLKLKFKISKKLKRSKRSKRHFGGVITDIQTTYIKPVSDITSNTLNLLLGPTGNGLPFLSEDAIKLIKKNKTKIMTSIGFLSALVYYEKLVEQNKKNIYK